MSTKTKISIHNYNEGASAGKYALKNLSSAGKFANFVYAIPQRFKLVNSGSSLILKQGSMVPIFNGTGANSSIYQTIAKDLVASYGKQINPSNTTFTANPASYQYVVYNVTKNALEWGPYTKYSYSASTNLFTNTSGEKCSCPLGVLDAKGVLKSFNAISFCGYFIFVDMGVEYDCPSGLDISGRQVDNHVFVPALKASEITSKKNNSPTGAVVLLDGYGAVTISSGYEIKRELTTHTDYLYCVNDNKVYSPTNAVVELTKVAKIDLAEGLVKNIYEPNFFYGSKFADGDTLTDVVKLLDAHKAEADAMHAAVESALQSLNTYVAKAVTDFNTIKPTLNEKTGEFTWRSGRPDLEKEPPVIRS